MPGRVAMAAIAAALCCAATPRASVENLDFELHRGHLIVIAGRAGSRTDLRLLVDTGTSRTVVDADVAASLALQGEPTSIHTFGRTMAGTDVRLPDFGFGSVRADNLRAVATDLTATAESLDLPRLDGIVGMDVLRRTALTIDYQRRRLAIGTASAVRHTVPLSGDPVFPVVNVDIAGVPAELIVDTGASHLVLFLPAGDRTFEQAGAVAASMLGGTVAIRALLLPELRFGALRLIDLPAVVAEAPVVHHPVRGLLAPTALGASIVQFDFSRRQLGWSR